MKKITMTCKKCNGTMSIDEEQAIKILSCPFCGAKEMLVESDDVKIARIEAERELSEKQMEIEYKKGKEEKEHRESNIATIGALVMLLILILVGIICSITAEKYIEIPFSSASLNNKPLVEVVSLMEDTGFKNIEIMATNDLQDAFLSDKEGQVGKVAKVSINGKTVFNTSGFLRGADRFPEKAPVTIWYYSYPTGSEKNSKLSEIQTIIDKYSPKE